MRGVQQGTQGARQGRAQAANKVRQADGKHAAPWDELELDDPIQLGHRVVALLPVAVEPDYLVGLLVHHHDVRGHLPLGMLVVFQLQPRVDVEDLAQPVLVVLELAPLDLVVGLLRVRLLGLLAGGDVRPVLVHPAGDAPVVLPLGDLVDLGGTLGGVEVAGRKRQDHPVDGQELQARAFLLLVVPQL